jgi:hypothetical protein
VRTAQDTGVTELTGTYRLQGRTHPGPSECNHRIDDGFLAYPWAAGRVGEDSTVLGAATYPALRTDIRHPTSVRSPLSPSTTHVTNVPCRAL